MQGADVDPAQLRAAASDPGGPAPAGPAAEAPRSLAALSSSQLTLMLVRAAFAAVLLYWTLLLLMPFSSLLLWTVVMAVSLHPLHAWLTKRLNGRPRTAAVVVTIGAILVLTIPSIWLATSIIESARTIYDNMDHTFITAQPPDWVGKLPLIGAQAHDLWVTAGADLGSLLVKFGAQIKTLAVGALRLTAGAGIATVTFLASIVVAGFVLPGAPKYLLYFRRAMRNLDPERGGRFLDLAGESIRTVARGVVGISVLQALLAGLGFGLAGFPQADLLTSMVLILGVIQIGAALVILPAIVASWFLMEPTMAVLFTVYMLCVNAMDNILKPFLMGRGLDTPALVILIGVIGGTVTFGLAGIFLGPIVMTIMWSVLSGWLEDSSHDRDAPGNAPAAEAEVADCP